MGNKKIKKMIAITQSFLCRHETVIFWVLAIAYKLALDVLYVFAASPKYQTEGLILDFRLWKYIIATIMYLVIYMLLPRTEKDTVSFLFHLQFVFTVAPMLTFYSLANDSTRYMLYVFSCVVLQAMLIRIPAKSSKVIHVNGLQNWVLWGILAMITYSLVGMIAYNGFEGLRAFDMTYIYEMRENLVYPPGTGYFINWLTKAILPFAFLYALEYKRYWLAVISGVLQVLFYILTGNKVTLLILVPIAVIYYFAKTGHLLKLMYLGMSGVSIVVTLAWQFRNVIGLYIGNTLCALFGVRAVFHPADNKFNFYACFSEMPKTFFSDGQIGKMFGLTYPYEGSLGQVMYAWRGGEFLEANYNAGYLADAYAQLGLLGMVLMSVLLAVMICSLRRYDRSGYQNLIVALFSVYFIVLNDGALFTTLFTGGMLIAYGLVFVFLKKRAEGETYGV